MAGMISKWGSARLLQSEPILKIIDAIGELDALLAIAHFNERFADSSVWPEFIVGDRYRLEAKGLKAPCIQAAGSCVANDVILQGGRPLIITGPNSAGKSTLLSAITHNHILAQIGAKVIAEHFCSTIIDQVLYQGPESAALNAEGRFGMEMLETKRLFERASRKSLFVLDEVAGGTSTEESREIAQWIVHEGLVELGCGVLMVTHDHELARRLGTLGKVEPIKMDLEDEAPTYQAAPGVATSSRPDRVLNAIGFTREHMLEIVRRKQQAGSDIP
jgi:DNA mismatch repair ATPase MutS